MTHSREFYLLDDEPSIDDWAPGYGNGTGAYPAYFPAEDRIGAVYYAPANGGYYPSYLDPTPGFYKSHIWLSFPLTRLNP